MNPRDIGSRVDVKSGIETQTASAAVTGAKIDRMGFLSCVLFVDTGAVSGSPSAVSVAGKLQHSADGSTGWSDVAGAAITAIAAAKGNAQVNVDLTMCQRYIRAVVTPSLTGGSSPAIVVAASVVLGGADQLPV